MACITLVVRDSSCATYVCILRARDTELWAGLRVYARYLKAALGCGRVCATSTCQVRPVAMGALGTHFSSVPVSRVSSNTAAASQGESHMNRLTRRSLSNRERTHAPWVRDQSVGLHCAQSVACQRTCRAP